MKGKAMTDCLDGIGLIAAERKRQIEVEGRSHAHDDEHIENELLMAAMAYASAAKNWGNALFFSGALWPFEAESWKPHVDPICNLVKAGALLAAEIDRLLRQRAKTG